MVLGNGGFSTFVGDGRGNFNAGPLVGANGGHIALGDFNQDGRVDFVEIAGSQAWVSFNK